MGVLEALTCVFILFKVLGIIDWSWFQVCIPVVIAFGLYSFLIFFFIFSKIRYKILEIYESWKKIFTLNKVKNKIK